MRSLFFSSVGGASGDMILSTLIGLGVNVDELNRDLKTLLPEENFAIVAVPVVERGFSGIRATVEIHEKHHAHHHHESHGEHIHQHVHHHPHRMLSGICAIINGSALPDSVKIMAIAVFRRLAEAEAKVHGTIPEQIHFHEVGAVDSIVDIVGSCLALHKLKIDAVQCGPLPLGTGTATCMHGVIPIPVPATVELLQGMEVVRTNEPFELVTPTGAALLSQWSADARPLATGRLAGAAYGFGQRQLRDRANLLRAEIMESDVASRGSDSCMVLECNLDDCNPEITAGAFEKLLQGGALDVFAQPLMMKKQRQGILLTVLCEPSAVPAMEDIIFRETTTFGIRRHLCSRTKLDRRHVEVDTVCGRIRIKVGSRQGQDITYAPEYEDCAAAAKLSGVPLKEVYRLALQGLASMNAGGKC